MLWGWKGRETYVERGWMDRGRCGGNYEARSVAGSAGVCQRILSWGLEEWDGKKSWEMRFMRGIYVLESVNKQLFILYLISSSNSAEKTKNKDHFPPELIPINDSGLSS